MSQQQAEYVTEPDDAPRPLITPLEAAELKLADDSTKMCHLEPRLRDALERELATLRDEAGQMWHWRNKYLSLRRQIANGVIVFDEMDGER